MSFDPRNMVSSEARIAEQDCVVGEKHDMYGRIMLFDSPESCARYKAHVGLSDHGIDPLTGQAWGRA